METFKFPCGPSLCEGVLSLVYLFTEGSRFWCPSSMEDGSGRGWGEWFLLDSLPWTVFPFLVVHEITVDGNLESMKYDVCLLSVCSSH